MNFNISPEEMGAFLGGVFRHMWLTEAYRIWKEDDSPSAILDPDVRWEKKRVAYFTAALENVVKSFPEFLRPRLLSQRQAAIADLVAMN